MKVLRGYPILRAFTPTEQYRQKPVLSETLSKQYYGKSIEHNHNIRITFFHQ